MYVPYLPNLLFGAEKFQDPCLLQYLHECKVYNKIKIQNNILFLLSKTIRRKFEIYPGT